MASKNDLVSGLKNLNLSDEEKQALEQVILYATDEMIKGLMLIFKQNPQTFVELSKIFLEKKVALRNNDAVKWTQIIRQEVDLISKNSYDEK